MVSVLEKDFEGRTDNGIAGDVGNGKLAIDRTVEQMQAFFPEQHAGGNVHGGDNGGNVTAWPDRVGA
jgi:hypothetical protein